MSRIDPEVLSLLGAGRKIEAIKRIREATGCSLAEAKEIADRLVSGHGPAELPAPRSSFPTSSEVPPEVHSLIAEGKTLEAIRLLRERTGLGLKESKDRVDEIARLMGGKPTESGCLGALVIVLGTLVAVAAGAFLN